MYNEGARRHPLEEDAPAREGDTPARWRVAPSLITLTNDYANYMIKLMIITNIS
jgi:hypothetical protein